MPAITTVNYANVTVITFTDQRIVDETKMSQLYQELSTVADTEGGKLLIDFSNVRFMASAFLGKLLLLNKRCKAQASTLKLCSIAPELMEFFKVTHLDKAFDMYEDEAKAIAAFSTMKRPDGRGKT